MTVTAVQLQTVVDSTSPTACSSVNTNSPCGRSAPANAAMTRVQVAEIHQRVGRHDQVEGVAVGSRRYSVNSAFISAW